MKPWVSVLTVLALLGGLTLCVFLLSAGGSTSATIVTPVIDTQRVKKFEYPPLPGRNEPKPRAVVRENTYDFGTMDVTKEHEHAFEIHNAGEGRLVLRVGETTCQCTMAGLVNDVVPPDGVGKITLRWTTKGGNVEDYRETAEILTNDDQNRTIKFVIKGKVRDYLMVQPPRLVFSGASASRPTKEVVRVASAARDDFKITDIVSSLPKDKLTWVVKPGSPEGLARMRELSGYRDLEHVWEIDITLQPGLPLGRFREMATIHTSIPERPTYDLDIEGLVVGDIYIAGRNWNQQLGVLELGNVARSQGKKHTLQMYVPGQHPDIHPRVVRKRPEFLQLTPVLADEKPLRYLLELEVPPGSPLSSYPGTRDADGVLQIGEIFLATDHPTEKEVRILVTFAVEAK